ncbi:MAG: BON domain-containing protein [Elusimicrobiota bacterium]|nr:MAG: BON domain-containing protein [Elusimicrobiota bacterium]
MRRLLSAILLLSLLAPAACRHRVEDDDLSDQAIKVRIESLLRGRRDLDIQYVTIDVNSGVATLSGIVPNIDQQRIIRRLAAGVRGVDQVLNNLLVQE